MASHMAVFPSKVSFSEATRNITGTRKVAVTTSVHFAAAAAAAAAAPQRKRNTQVVLVPAMASCMAVFPSKVSFSEAPRNIAGTRKVSATSSVHFAAAAAAAAAPHVEVPEKPCIPVPPRHRHAEVTHTLPPEKLEIFKSLEKWAESNLLPRLKPVEECWQPTDLLPDPTSESFHEEVGELRRRSRELPDDYLVCLVGDMVSEEALPTNQTLLNNLDGIRDETGASLTPWAVWTRAWTAEENRHGDLLNKYLYLTGRVDMKKIEKTIQYLMRAGMDFRTENNPYSGFIYTSFQERATSISHGNTARLAKAHGDAVLARICGTIAAEEKRHEAAYVEIVEKLFEVDPDGTVLAFADRMRKKVSMPARLMFDGRDGNLFAHFAAVAQRVGVYTAKDYADILEFLLRRWKVEELRGLSPEGRAAQEFLCGLAPKIRRVEQRAQAKANAKTMAFSWIFDKEVQL